MSRNHHPPPSQTPGPKIPEHLSTSKPAKTREQKIDRQVEDSFPASDPPSYSGGNHIVGAPDHDGEKGKKPSKH
jgi:hypothetical protein